MDVELAKFLLSILGAVTGVTALIWRAIDEFGSYLRIGLKVDGPRDGWITVLTSVENKGSRIKSMTYAALLIGPEAENPIDTANIISARINPSQTAKYTNDISRLVVREPIAVGDRMLIPLSFYYSENVDFADESLTYRVPVKVADFAASSPYAVRFYVFPPGRLHRSTQDAFVTEPEEV